METRKYKFDRQVLLGSIPVTVEIYEDRLNIPKDKKPKDISKDIEEDIEEDKKPKDIAEDIEEDKERMDSIISDIEENRIFCGDKYSLFENIIYFADTHDDAEKVNMFLSGTGFTQDEIKLILNFPRISSTVPLASQFLGDGVQLRYVGRLYKEDGKVYYGVKVHNDSSSIEVKYELNKNSKYQPRFQLIAYSVEGDVASTVKDYFTNMYSSNREQRKAAEANRRKLAVKAENPQSLYTLIKYLSKDIIDETDLPELINDNINSMMRLIDAIEDIKDNPEKHEFHEWMSNLTLAQCKNIMWKNIPIVHQFFEDLYDTKKLKSKENIYNITAYSNILRILTFIISFIREFREEFKVHHARDKVHHVRETDSESDHNVPPMDISRDSEGSDSDPEENASTGTDIVVDAEPSDFSSEEDAGGAEKIAKACKNALGGMCYLDDERFLEGLQELDDCYSELKDEDEIVKKMKETTKAYIGHLAGGAGPVEVFELIENSLNFNLDDTHPLKDMLDLYQGSMKAIAEEYISYSLSKQIQDKNNKDEPYKLFLADIRDRLNDFFAELGVSTVNDKEKVRILLAVLKEIMLEKKSAILDLQVDFSSAGKGNSHLATALNQIQQALNKDRELFIEKAVTFRENEVFYKDVICNALKITCEHYVEKLYLTIESEFKAASEKSGNTDPYYAYFPYFNPLNDLTHMEILENILEDKEASDHGKAHFDLKRERVYSTNLILSDRVNKALDSFSRVKQFYDMLNRHVRSPYHPSFRDELGNKIDIFKRKSVHEKTTQEDAFFVDQIEKIANQKLEHQSNYLHELLKKLSSLSIIANPKMIENELKFNVPWSDRDEQGLMTILSRIKGGLTTQTFMDAVIENETRVKDYSADNLDSEDNLKNNRVSISEACIIYFVEYLGCMEELVSWVQGFANFANKSLPNIIGVVDADSLLPAWHSILAKMEPNLLNQVVKKIDSYNILAEHYNLLGSNSLDSLTYIFTSIKAITIGNINPKRQNKKGEKIPDLQFASMIDKENLLTQKEKDMAYAFSKMNYIPKYDGSNSDQYALFHRLQTINALDSSCEAFKIHLADRIESLLTNEIRNELTTKEAIVLQIKNAILNKNQRIYNMVANKKDLKNAVLSYLAIQRLQDCLQQGNDADPYEKLLAFEAKFNQRKHIFEKEKTSFAKNFLKAVPKKQDSDIILHHACQVFEKEMYNNEVNPSAGKKEKMIYSQQRYAVTNMKQELINYKTRPQVAVNQFKKKLDKHIGKFEKHKDGVVTKFLQVIAGVFGYVLKSSATNEFYTKTINTLFADASRKKSIETASPGLETIKKKLY